MLCASPLDLPAGRSKGEALAPRKVFFPKTRFPRKMILIYFAPMGAKLCRGLLRLTWRENLIETYPQWLQGAEWPFRAGRPLCFVGQLDAAVKRDGCLRRTAFYVFWNPQTGESETIQQHD